MQNRPSPDLMFDTPEMLSVNLRNMRSFYEGGFAFRCRKGNRHKNVLWYKSGWQGTVATLAPAA